MLQRGLVGFIRNQYVLITRRIEHLGKPLEALRFIDHALHKVAQGTRPINRELGAEFVAYADYIFHAFRSIRPYFGRFSRRACAPNCMKKCFTGHHRATQSILREGLLQAGEDLRLAVSHQVFGPNYVCIVGCPISDTNFGKVMHYLSRRYRFARWSMKESLSLVGCGPLRSGDVVLPSSFRWVAPAARL